MFNWLDIILFVILAVTLVLGCIKGLIRQLVGILAVVIGLILSMGYYQSVGSFYRPLVASDSLAYFLGFLTIFLFVLLLGWLISRIFSKVMKGSLKFINHILGGFFGLLKGVLICGVIVFALLVFPINTEVLKKSFAAPYCLKITKGVVELIPKQLKIKFKDAYKEIIGRGGKNVERV